MTYDPIGDVNRELQAAVEAEQKKYMDGLVDHLREGTPVDTGEAQAGWYHDGESIHNDVSHVEALNQGTSDQAPEYFIERTLLSQPGVNPSGTIVRSKL